MEQTKRHLKAGEMICDKCKGVGHFDAGVYLYKICKKCDGTGIVDWVENVVGKLPDLHEHDDIYDALAKNLADEIDKQIIESVLKESEQTVK